MNKGKPEKLSMEQVAAGFLRVANEAMCRPIRTYVSFLNPLLTYRLTEARGFECASHNLVMFGGAGGQHGCSIATTLGIKRIIIPRLSSLLSAYGMALADVVVEMSEPAALKVTQIEQISERMTQLVKRAEDNLRSQRFAEDRISSEKYLNCRYQGTSTQLMIEQPKDGDYSKAFYEEHKQQFGFNLEDRDVLIDDIRVRGVGKSVGYETRSPFRDFKEFEKRDWEAASATNKKKVYFDEGGWLDTAVVSLSELKDGNQVRVSRTIAVTGHVLIYV